MGGLIEEARFVMGQIGCTDRPIHLTEAGWPHYYMGEEKQGAYSVRGLLLAAAAGASTYYWYTFWDSEILPDTVAPTEHTFGVMTWPASAEDPGEKKPSFHVLKGANSILGTTRYAGDLARELGWEKHLHALAFVDDEGRFTVASWQSLDELESEVSLEIPVPAGSTGWSRYDQSGSPKRPQDGLEPLEGHMVSPPWFDAANATYKATGAVSGTTLEGVLHSIRQEAAGYDGL